MQLTGEFKEGHVLYIVSEDTDISRFALSFKFTVTADTNISLWNLTDASGSLSEGEF